MKKSKKILLKWAATYGEDESDVRASMYNEDMMIEFAKYYHKQKLTLTNVSQQRELLIAVLKEWELGYVSFHNLEKELAEKLLKAINCG